MLVLSANTFVGLARFLGKFCDRWFLAHERETSREPLDHISRSLDLGPGGPVPPWAGKLLAAGTLAEVLVATQFTIHPPLLSGLVARRIRARQNRNASSFPATNRAKAGSRYGANENNLKNVECLSSVGLSHLVKPAVLCLESGKVPPLSPDDICRRGPVCFVAISSTNSKEPPGAHTRSRGGIETESIRPDRD